MTFLKTIFAFLPLMVLAGCDEGSKPLSHPACQVRYRVVEERSVTLTSDLPGRVSALVVSEVRPQVNGIIQKRLFEEGTNVLKGQALYQIDPALYKAAYNTAKAALAEAEARETALALQKKRQHNLIKANAVSRQDLDNTISEHGQAVAQIAKAKAELESAAINLAYTRIEAPIAGRIGTSSVTPGALVTANQSEPLAIIQQTERVYVDISRSSSDIIRLRRALASGNMVSEDSVLVRLKLEDGSPYTRLRSDKKNDPPQWITGSLLFTDISVAQSTGSVMLRAVFDNPDGLLLPGMYVTAVLEEGVLEKTVLVPQSSVLANSSGGHSVYVLHEDHTKAGCFQVKRRSIRLGRSYGHDWIVSEGLEEGDLLVVEGLQKIVPDEVISAEKLQQDLR